MWDVISYIGELYYNSLLKLYINNSYKHILIIDNLTKIFYKIRDIKYFNFVIKLIYLDSYFNSIIIFLRLMIINNL